MPSLDPGCTANISGAPSVANNNEGAGVPAVLGQWSQDHENLLTESFPLHRACRDGNLEVLNHLLSTTCSSNNEPFAVLDPFCGWTPSLWAAYFGQLECLQRVTSLTGVALAVRSSSGLTALHTAALGGRPACLQWLLQIGAPYHLTDSYGETVLHKAARSGSFECSRILAVCGVDYSARNNDGLTALQISSDPEKKASSLNPMIHVSGNAYYGFQPLPSTSNMKPSPTTNGHCHQDADMESEEIPSVDCECGSVCCRHHGQNNLSLTNGYQNGNSGYSANINGYGDTNGHINNVFANNLINGGHVNGHVNGQDHKNGHGNGYHRVNGSVDVPGRKRSLTTDLGEISAASENAIKRMRQGEPSTVASMESPPPPSVTPVVCAPSTSSGVAIKRCEMAYPRCMMGHYM